MDDAVFFEIAHELKALQRAGVQAVASGDLAHAGACFERALGIARTVGFREGAGQALFNLAGTYALQGRALEALRAQADARGELAAGGADAAPCDAAIRKLWVLVKRRGVEHERAGAFAAAIEHFTAAIPHADPGARAAMEHEVALLRRIVHDGERGRRGGAEGAQPEGD